VKSTSTAKRDRARPSMAPPDGCDPSMDCGPGQADDLPVRSRWLVTAGWTARGAVC
jgi:hypothetical protein